MALSVNTSKLNSNLTIAGCEYHKLFRDFVMRNCGQFGLSEEEAGEVCNQIDIDYTLQLAMFVEADVRFVNWVATKKKTFLEKIKEIQHDPRFQQKARKHYGTAYQEPPALEEAAFSDGKKLCSLLAQLKHFC
jgi:hypothetical protein